MCFGHNDNYQLGIRNGGADALYLTEPCVTLSSDQEIISVHVGERTGHIVYSDNTVYAFGRNLYGTLGDGSQMLNNYIIVIKRMKLRQ